MGFNVSKSKIMIFNSNNTIPAPTYKLNEKALKQVTDSKYLGVILQENLSFNKYVEEMISTA